MAEPVGHRARHERAASGARPPRWTFPLFTARLRVSVGLGAWVVAAVGVGVWDPPSVVPWLPLLILGGMVASTLVHEGAHALAAHNLGYRVEWVVLGGLAGLTAYFGRDDRPLDRAAVALAGPAASALLVLLLVGLRATLAPMSSTTDLVELAIAVNALALVGNLLPLRGSDGAHLVRSLAEHRRLRSRAAPDRGPA